MADTNHAFDRINAIKACTILAALLLALAISTNAMAAKTQIVVQWRYQGSAGITMLWRIYFRENHISKRCADLCFVDGHDLGGGTANIFLYTDDDNVDATVQAVVSLLEEEKLPTGMQIGIADYMNNERTDWTYRPAFPPELEHFSITYPGDRRGL